MPKTLLLADDSVTMQKVVGITFANEDVRLVTVDNGDDALERAREVRPSVVLADVGMPGLNGYELCAAIKSEPELKHIKVVLLTGTFDTYDESRAREVGADAHVSKPFEAQALVEQVRALISRAEEEASGKRQTPSPEALENPRFDFDTSERELGEPTPRPEPPTRARADVAAKPKPEPAKPKAEAPPKPTPERVAPQPAGRAAAAPAPAAAQAPVEPDAIDDLYDDSGFGDSSEQMSPILGHTPTPIGAQAAEAYDLVDEPATDSGIFGEAFPSPPSSLAEDTAPDLLVQRDARGMPVVEFEETVIEAMPDDGDDVLDVSDELLEIPDDAEPPILTAPTQPRPAPAKPAAASPAKPAPAPKPTPAPAAPAAKKPAAEPLPWAEPLDDAEPFSAASPFSLAEKAEKARPSARRESAPVASVPGIDPQRIQDAIEKVAWEAFGPLAEQVVREVSRKVEAIAWETIPVLAERIIREEIARLKADPDD